MYYFNSLLVFKSLSEILIMRYHWQVLNLIVRLVSCQFINRHKLNKEWLAKYSLAYYWAQDKSGMDVDKDSLIRQAFCYYSVHKTLPLSARAMYYMGKYYTLTDSIEKANNCLEQAVELAKVHSDVETECLSTYALSKNERFFDLLKAESLAAYATELYTSLNCKDTINWVCYMLNEMQASAYNKHIEKALLIGDKALKLACQKGDSSIISLVFQDISFVYYHAGKPDSALQYSKLAYIYNETKDFSLKLSLANDYIYADSLVQAKNILRELDAEGKKVRNYNKFYSLLMLSIKEGDSNQALVYADSTLACIEDMHLEELASKIEYYQELSTEIKEKTEIKERARNSTIVWGAFMFCILLLLGYVLHIHFLNKKNSKILLDAEKERNRLALEWKEVQISTMQKYIEQKVKVLNKLTEIKDNPNKKAVLSKEDWFEIEVFLESFDNAFVSRLRGHYEHLTEEDVKLLMLLRLNISSKVLAAIYNIEENSIRHKLLVFKSKLGLSKSDASIRVFIGRF